MIIIFCITFLLTAWQRESSNFLMYILSLISTILLGVTLYSFQKIDLLNPLFNSFDNLELSSVDKVTIGT